MKDYKYKDLYSKRISSHNQSFAIYIIASAVLIGGLATTAGVFIYKSFHNANNDPTPVPSVNKYSLTLDANGGTFNDGSKFQIINNIEKGTKLSKLEIKNPIKSESKFTSWSYLGNNISSDFEISKDSTIKAIYSETEIKFHTISFNSNGGSKVESQKIVDGGKAIYPHSSFKNHELKYWYLNKESEPYDFSNAVKKNFTLNAKWEELPTPIETYSVYIDGNGGKFDDKESITLNSVTKNTILNQIEGFPKEAPKKENATFLGYMINELIIDETTYKVTNNIVIKAKWDNKATYSVSLYGNGGKFNDTETLVFNNVNKDTILDQIEGFPKEDPKKKDSSFVGYYVDDALIDTSKFKITKNTLIKAKWLDMQQYKVVLDANGGKFNDTETLVFNNVNKDTILDQIEGFPLQNPTKEKSIFKGYTIEGELINKSSYAIVSDVVIKAKWEDEETFTVVLNSGEGKFKNNKTTIFAYSVNKDTLLNNIEGYEIPFTEDDTYTFAYWTCNGIKIDNIGSFKITRDVSLIATYTSSLLFTATEKNCAVSGKIVGELLDPVNIIYSKDNGNSWNTFIKGYSGNSTNIVLENVGDSVLIKNESSTLNSDADKDYFYFITVGKISCSGNINSMINNSGLKRYCFSRLFGATTIISAPKLPSKSLEMYCYYMTFASCNNLLVCPELPAKNIEEGCYKQMFWDCGAISKIPELNATELKKECYMQMFLECDSLVDLSDANLPATKLYDKCYQNMFLQCKNLKYSPQMNATSLAPSCCKGMFNQTALINPPNLPATTLKDYCYSDMFYKCENLKSAPTLPATSLKQYCYYYMFYGCSSLKVTTSSSGTLIFKCPNTSPTSCVDCMFEQTGGSFKDKPVEGTTYRYI